MLIKNMLKVASIAVGFSLLAGSFQQSEAAILGASGNGSLGDISGTSLSNGNTQSPFIQGFDELQSVSVSSPIFVDYLISPNNIGQQLRGVNNASANSPVLADGVYDSHIFHFDPSTSGGSVGDATFQFDGDIIAVIANTEFLVATDSVFGAADTYATGGDRRSETNDLFTIVSNDTIRFDQFQVGGRYIDDLRVLTAASPTEDVPEPTAVLSLSIFGFLGISRKLLQA